MDKLTAMAVALLFAATLNAMSLADARGKIDSIVANPADMTAVMQQLSAADQKSFVAEMNAAIASLPGSAEEKSAKVVNVARAALKGAAKDKQSLQAVVAEIFATAPVESLCALNESLAKDVFNRAADPKRAYTDDQFAKIAKDLVAAVNARVAGSEDAAVRGGFAALMMVRASNGSPASLAGELADTLGDSAKVAKEEWFPEALGNKHNYDPMLASTKAEKAPDTRAAAIIAGPQRHAMLLGLLAVEIDPTNDTVNDGFGDAAQSSFDRALYTRPRTIEDKPWNPDPKPYYGQNF